MIEEKFNGQINISRDLRLNKQTVIGKFDLTDIIFLSIGIIVAILISYILGFSPLKMMDELTAIFISLIPMSIILSFGFRRVAGMRQFEFIRMQQIDKKSKFRVNRIKGDVKKSDDFIVCVESEKRHVNKYLKKFLDYENLKLLSIRYLKDKVIYLLDLEYKDVNNIFYDIVEKFSLNNELKSIPVEKMKEQEDILDKMIRNNEVVVYMLNVYNSKNYRIFIKKVKKYALVLQYFKKVDKVKYVNTFLIIDKEENKGNNKKKATNIEQVENLCSEYEIVLDRLIKEQNASREAISYLMTNPFNAYRVYR